MGFGDDLARHGAVWELGKIRRLMQRQQVQQAPKGKYQRLPDGTWGYPPEPQAEDATAAFERGWRLGWEAGYAAAQQAQQAPPT